jgi:chemotaxis signal transduction protein
VFSFPHTSHEILGVILRRGRVIPLYDLAGLLKLPESAPAQYHLIALCRTAETTGLAAFPVSGECDLISADVLAMKHPASGVVGELTWDGRSYELLNLEELILSQNAQLQPVPETPAAGSTV